MILVKRRVLLSLESGFKAKVKLYFELKGLLNSVVLIDHVILKIQVSFLFLKTFFFIYEMDHHFF